MGNGHEEIRKGPWNEEEDVKLAMYVKLFGDRRWDFIAKVSGLKRNGKSCRLRWINYLNPGLKGGKMTAQEQLLVLQLHSKWGNRWSRIASNLPGRTDNEIKNFWRTHTRKKAHEERKCSNSASTSSSYSKSIETETGHSMGIDNISSCISNNNVIFSSDLAVAPMWEWDSLWNMDWEQINNIAFTPHVIINPSTNFCRLL